ncbi:hypothetical protein C8R43DRAFT_1241223 [Mycena crocata]|nr:hypothetical protein C8R43DRAFT_1241223 [Mycena crocata]
MNTPRYCHRLLPFDSPAYPDPLEYALPQGEFALVPALFEEDTELSPDDPTHNKTLDAILQQEAWASEWPHVPLNFPAAGSGRSSAEYASIFKRRGTSALPHVPLNFLALASGRLFAKPAFMFKRPGDRALPPVPLNLPAAASGRSSLEYPSTHKPAATKFKFKDVRERIHNKQSLSCFFCRQRKIACMRSDESSADPACNQCSRRNIPCNYPTVSHRGRRMKADAVRKMTDAAVANS